MTATRTYLASSVLVLSACVVTRPPVAAVHPHRITAPAGTREDPYYWLRDDSRTDKRVLAHLRAENAYTAAATRRSSKMRRKLFEEIVGHFKQDDSSAPVRSRGYRYYSRRVKGGEYLVYCRTRDVPGAPEEILLDGNQLAKGHRFFTIGDYEVSDDNTLLTYTVDYVGRDQFTVRYKDLTSGRLLPDAVENAEAGLAWAADGRTVLYTEKDPVTLLGTRIKAHRLGTATKADRTIYEEKDHAFYISVERSRSRRLLYITAQSTVSTEIWWAEASDPSLHFSVILPRERDHEYFAEDLGEKWLIRTNFQAPNHRIVEVPMNEVRDRSRWRDVVAHRTDAFLESFQTFRDFIAISERSGGLSKIRVKQWSRPDSRLIEEDEPTYAATLGKNPEVDTTVLRYGYTSLVTPDTAYDYDVATDKRTLVKQQVVLGGFRREDYATEYLHVPIAGVEVPVSVVYRKSTPRNGTAPLLQEGYGAYGLCEDAHFELAHLPLLDRGFVYAIAHVRGGQELGRAWYDDGKLMHKKNTFTDFVAVTDYLVAHGYAAKDRVFARGGSAGGLLMGAVANLAADRYRALIANVPFVDVVTTMLDESIPLTTNEFDEWGDPKDPAAYHYMLSYSPYDNVRAQPYPAMLVTTGLRDGHVQYYEPAKWVAKLRAYKTDRNPLLLKTNMDAGHGGRSGQLEHYHELAFEYAFLLDQLTIARH